MRDGGGNGCGRVYGVKGVEEEEEATAFSATPSKNRD